MKALHLPPGQLTNMPASFTNFLSNSLPDHGSATAEASSPQRLDSIACSSQTNDRPENDEPQRKRRRVRNSPSPAAEVVSLLSEDEEADKPVQPVQPTTRRPQSPLQETHDQDDSLNVSCSGAAIPLRPGETVEGTEGEAVPDIKRHGFNGGAEDNNMSWGPKQDQQASAPVAGPSIITSDTFPVSTEPKSQSADQSQEPPRIRAVIEPPLCLEQAELVEIIMSGRNVFYTGSAGCGKSTVLKAFTRRLRDRGLRVDIVAPTGISALGVGGSTTFVYAGWNLSSFKQSLDKVRRGAHGKHVRKRLKDTDVLVIDEISS
ncbi:hypothetical protein F4803DRAFT_539012, partial [Xylaria telfairii]